MVISAIAAIPPITEPATIPPTGTEFAEGVELDERVGMIEDFVMSHDIINSTNHGR